MEPKPKVHIAGARRKGLQSHVAFFDADQDGTIWPTDTYNGFREIGFGVFFASLAMVFIHLGFSWFTGVTLLPDPFFRIQIAGIQNALHGSDTGTFTQTGDLDQARFDYVFALYSAPPHTHMTFKEGVRMVHRNRNMWDFFGWFASACDWAATYLLLWPEDGCVAKQDVHDILDGSLFPKLAQNNKNRNKIKKANTNEHLSKVGNKNVNANTDTHSNKAETELETKNNMMTVNQYFKKVETETETETETAESAQPRKTGKLGRRARKASSKE
ncbi:Caleosin related protein-domain-containing protein [Mycena olivaceomarginata]|nr:Caleosin related protein-domain-containing protein [Mycena olivaceomarginata]